MKFFEMFRWNLDGTPSKFWIVFRPKCQMNCNFLFLLKVNEMTYIFAPESSAVKPKSRRGLLCKFWYLGLRPLLAAILCQALQYACPQSGIRFKAYVEFSNQNNTRWAYINVQRHCSKIYSKEVAYLISFRILVCCSLRILMMQQILPAVLILGSFSRLQNL